MRFLRNVRWCKHRLRYSFPSRCYAVNVRAEPVILRPYQESCLQACIDTLTVEGVRRIGVSLPTGSGKTTIFVSLISRLPPRGGNKLANRALIIVNSIELARQATAQVESLFPGLSVEMEQGTKHKASGVADVTVATYQTLLQGQRIAKFDPRFLKAIIVDEAHHAAAPSYRRILGHFDSSISPGINVPLTPEEDASGIPIIGFSATFGRHDGISLGSVFDKIVYHRDFLQMIKEKWLCELRFTSVRARINLSKVTVNSRTGDFNPTSLAHVINTDTVNKLVVRTWLDRASKRKSTLVFCVNLSHVRDLTHEFRETGIDARYLHARTPMTERKDLLSDFKNGVFPVLVNCAILTEGADIPNIDCVILTRPTRSRNVFAQMIGRGMRLSPQTGKKDCHLIDFVDSTTRVSGVVSIPTLFGLDTEEEIKDETMASLEERAERSSVNSSGGYVINDVPTPTSVTYTDYENPFSLVYGASGSPHIATLSSHAWVACGDEVYVLECLGRGHIRIEPLPENDPQKGQPTFQAHFTPASPDRGQARMNPYRRSRRILTAQSLRDAVRGCDTYAKEKVVFGKMALALFRTAAWRKKLASQNQKELILKRRGLAQKQEASDTHEQLSLLTQGEAANIITRLKHGAQARYASKMREAKKIVRQMEKESRYRAREEVKVGPLSTTASSEGM